MTSRTQRRRWRRRRRRRSGGGFQGGAEDTHPCATPRSTGRGRHLRRTNSVAQGPCGALRGGCACARCAARRHRSPRPGQRSGRRRRRRRRPRRRFCRQPHGRDVRAHVPAGRARLARTEERHRAIRASGSSGPQHVAPRAVRQEVHADCRQRHPRHGSHARRLVQVGVAALQSARHAPRGVVHDQEQISVGPPAFCSPRPVVAGHH
mmetsp:Transcript_30870/g.77313  ORF Transcript_30870/g.77313 Transcript_30870/m.77313 type:complete len:207 (-) Transcript_30870:4448-5068(-)